MGKFMDKLHELKERYDLKKRESARNRYWDE